MEKKSNGLRGGTERGRGGTGDWERENRQHVCKNSRILGGCWKGLFHKTHYTSGVYITI